MIGRNEHYDTIIVFETKDSQIPTNKEQENGETNDSFLFHGQCHQWKPAQRLILHPQILNLLGITLSKNQIKLKSKGLIFTPTLKTNTPEIKIGIKDLTRKLRVRGFSADENDSNENTQDL